MTISIAVVTDLNQKEISSVRIGEAIACMEDCADIPPPVDGRFVSALLAQLDACAVRTAAADRENAKLKQQAAALEQENQDHKNVIEKLKRLDIQLEKRRRNMQ